MRYRKLGRTNLEISEIGIGGIGPMGKYGPVAADGTSARDPGEPTGSYRGNPHFEVAPEGFARTMARAEELGVNFLDTAPSYGRSEEIFGHYLKNPRQRQNWIVCTKTGVCGSMGDGAAMAETEIVAMAEASLERLQIDEIDVLLIHSVDQYGTGTQALEHMVESGMVSALEKLKAAGKIRFFGISGMLPQLSAAAQSDLFDVTLTYNTYNLLVRDAEQEFLPLCVKKDLGVLLGGVFHGGLLSGDAGSLSRKAVERFYEVGDPGLHLSGPIIEWAERLQAFAGGDGADLRRLGLRFALSHPGVSTIVSGIRNIAEIEENAAAVMAGPLSAEEQSALAEALAGMPAISWNTRTQKP